MYPDPSGVGRCGRAGVIAAHSPPDSINALSESRHSTGGCLRGLPCTAPAPESASNAERRADPVEHRRDLRELDGEPEAHVSTRSPRPAPHLYVDPTTAGSPQREVSASVAQATSAVTG